MNKDKLEDTVKDVAGKVQQKVGNLTDDEGQQVKGVAEQAEGKIQKGYGDIKEKAKDKLKSS